MRDLISRREPEASCMAYVRSLGFHTLRDDGEEKIEWGITAREEVARVLSE